MSPRQVQKSIDMGSKTILGIMALGLMSFFSTWVFNTVVATKTSTIENRAMLEPLTVATRSLDTTIRKMNIDADMRNLDMMDALNKITTRMEVNEERLHNVISDCEENYTQIEKCKSLHLRKRGD